MHYACQETLRPAGSIAICMEARFTIRGTFITSHIKREEFFVSREISVQKLGLAFADCFLKIIFIKSRLARFDDRASRKLFDFTLFVLLIFNCIRMFKIVETFNLHN